MPHIPPRPSSRRARPLEPEERRAAIVDAVLPLLIEHGREITTRQIADAAGIAEGTVFRAFGDKESVIQAVVDRFTDPTVLLGSIASIDRGLPLEERMTELLSQLRRRFKGVIGIRHALGIHGNPPDELARRALIEQIAAVLQGTGEDSLPGDECRAAQYLLLVSVASVIPHTFDELSFSTPELTQLVLHGFDSLALPTTKERTEK